jgi:hypothetical protein
MDFYMRELCATNIMRGWGSNSRPPGLDTMMEGPHLPVQLQNPSDIEGAMESFIRFQQADICLPVSCKDRQHKDRPSYNSE